MKIVEPSYEHCVPIKVSGPKMDTYLSVSDVSKDVAIWTRFFNYTKHQLYSIKENRTKTSLTIMNREPKWFSQRINNMNVTNNLLFFAHSDNHLLLIQKNWTEISCSLIYFNPGMAFIENYKMIKMKPRIQTYYREFMSKIKSMNDIELNLLFNNRLPLEKANELGKRFDIGVYGELGILVDITSHV